MTETWRPVPGYEGYYDVSDHGRVRSWRAPARSRVRVLTEPHVLKRIDGRYLTVVLCGDTGRRTWAVHQLVASAFLGAKPESQEVRHLNGNCHDCRASNLAYGSHSENVRDAVRHGVLWQTRRTHCPQGHEYTPDNTAPYTTRIGASGRRCRRCKTERKAVS